MILQKEDVHRFAEEMDEEDKEEFLAMAEQIDREAELEQRKMIYLCDYRKRLKKGNAF